MSMPSKVLATSKVQCAAFGLQTRRCSSVQLLPETGQSPNPHVSRSVAGVKRYSIAT